MRWIAVAVSAALIAFGILVARLLPIELSWPLAALVVLLAACNAIYYWLIRGAAAFHPWLLPLQIYVDLAILTGLLHFSGGIENPFSFVMVFHVIIGGIVLSRRQCYLVAAAAASLFALLAWVEWAEVLPHYTLEVFPHFHTHEGVMHAAHMAPYVISSVAIQCIVLFLTAHFVTTLTERVRYDEGQLAAMAERAMAERGLLEQALETTGTALRVLDRDLQLHWSNERWKRWLARRDAAPDQTSAAWQTRDDGQVRVGELAVGASADSRVLQLTTAPLLDKDGRISQIVELAHDVTQQKQAQAQMMRAGQLAAVGQLAGQVAHEVNNPIAIISAKSRLLIRDHRQEMSDVVLRDLEKITELADRVGRIAQGLLSYGRPSTGAGGHGPPRADPQGAGQHRAGARGSGVRIQDRLPESLPFILANAGEMEQVFLNLFLNALDAMPRGGRLTIGAGAEGPMLEVLVEDTGGGIPEAIRERIFEPFFSTKEEGRGTGLGLSVCLGLVRSHGGTISVESPSGGGSRFTLRLPALKPAKEVASHG